MTDDDYMNLALDLAEQGKGFTSPNPLVGAVVVKQGRIVGKGWHKGPGLAHAEVEAIDDAGETARGSDLYVTLEPCNHFGRTPPCTKKIIEAGIKRVMVGTEDPNPFVTGGGIRCLHGHGIDVKSGVCRLRAESVIEDFIWYVRNSRKPFVILKCASTLDGRIATRTGHSQWITNELSRAYVHRLRHSVDAILVGSGTIKKDNPSLTARIDGLKTRDPRRIILDTHLCLDITAKVLTQTSTADTIIVTSEKTSKERKDRYGAAGATIVEVPECQGLLDLNALLEKLGSMEVMSLLIEGGGRVIHSGLKAGIINKVLFFLAPKLLGGDDGVPVCSGAGPEFMDDAFSLKKVKTSRFGDDILVQGYLK